MKLDLLQGGRALGALVFSFLVISCGGGGSSGESDVQITAQPVSVTVPSGQKATFTVTATGAAPLTYAWMKNGVTISGAVASSYVTPVLSVSDSQSQYTVTVSNATGSKTSSAAVLTVVPANAYPAITTAPSAVAVDAGQAAVFSVVASGAAPLSYQWLRNGQEIAGATAATYTVSAVTAQDHGSVFSVRVQNTYGNVTSGTATLTVNGVGLGHLVISEVSNCIYSDASCWVELYNPSSSAINLLHMALQVPSRNASSGADTGVQAFVLPSYTLNPGEYVVLAGNVDAIEQRSPTKLWLSAGLVVPNWSGVNGFVELLAADGRTVDFVRFGSSQQSPVTAGQWSGGAAAALGVTNDTLGHALVRPAAQILNTDTHTSSDWIKVAWTTPGGRNDVDSSAVDADGDGLPDSAEVSGGTYGGLDLYAMGARVGVRDIFIEVDRMSSADNGVAPRQTSLQMVVDAFAKRGIAIHFDAGTQFGSSFSTTAFNLGQGSNTVVYEPCITFDSTTCSQNVSTRRSIYDWKEESFDVRRRPIFHYMLFGNSQNTNGASGSSGVAEAPGNDIIITLGGVGLTGSAIDQNILTNFQASTVMHELGHNLGLLHGGDDEVNYKPNYYSIMNYLYSFTGLERDPSSSTVYLRWRYEKGDQSVSLCSLPNSPCDSPSQFIINYSNGMGSTLNESSLNESNNIGYGSTLGAYADWNQNNLVNTFVSKDLNQDGKLSVLHDHDDWGRIQLPFTSSYGGSQSISLVRRKTQIHTRINPMGNDKQPVIVERVVPKERFKHVAH